MIDNQWHPKFSFVESFCHVDVYGNGLFPLSFAIP